MTTNIDRAAEVAAQFTGSSASRRIAQALAADGLLAPEPHVVTREQVLYEVEAHERYLLGAETPEERVAVTERATDRILALLTTPAEKGGA